MCCRACSPTPNGWNRSRKASSSALTGCGHWALSRRVPAHYFTRVSRRRTGPAKQAFGFADYSDQIEKWFADRGSSVSISFRFVERIASNDVASERGIFQMVSKRADGDGRTFYGRFHTYARRTDGRWRICVDYDTDERSATLEEEFLAAIDVDDVDAFAA